MSINPALFDLSQSTGISYEELESYVAAVGFRMKQGNKEFNQQGVLGAMQEMKRDMEIEALNAQFQL
ncbi:hypothetical protein FGG65_gp34 [Corynebacterium phage phi673]|uniref:Uncharacterized protein n=2 Tax=Ikedavirus TaxID=2560149 RepID=A0A2H4PIZ1_9CAUD|nr:hypothetical protein FGG65_gp34 [Corynebacterium phage phi673]YP_009639767.1 hypothetical protein FGG66_gp32 [Corynebacterium phage phi674]ATW62896.1 hypothetical protein phi673_gp34 [Corynebacterium phage phi673]ATW62950.1 hypothetical protein phi674_gp32 [Corynebacterium phage phi674]